MKRTKYVTSELGFDCIGTFVLPESAWWNDYYHPFEKRLEEMKEKYLENNYFVGFAEEIYTEIETCRECSVAYGYIFYIMKKK